MTIIIPAYNEERNIDEKLRNVLAADYPQDQLDVIVVSDASTDRTNEIVRRYEPQGVRLIALQRRCGKSAGLNCATERARGSIIVFTDANAMFPPHAIRVLAERLDDPAIGLVTGYTRYDSGRGGVIAAVTNLYTRLERAIKRAESRRGCCVGADGAIFAIRRTMYQPLRDDDINDFVIPLRIVELGSRCVFAEDAWCVEQPGKDLDSEFRRQSRITNRTLWALWRHAHLLNAARFGWFSFFLFSHKVVRFLVPALLVLAAVSLVLMAGPVALYPLAVMAGATIGSRFVRVFLAVNVAVLQGWWHFLRGRHEVVWQHDRVV